MDHCAYHVSSCILLKITAVRPSRGPVMRLFLILVNINHFQTSYIQSEHNITITIKPTLTAIQDSGVKCRSHNFPLRNKWCIFISTQKHDKLMKMFLFTRKVPLQWCRNSAIRCEDVSQINIFVTMITKMWNMISSPPTPTVCQIFNVATWHYRCRHHLKNNCIWDNLQCYLLFCG